MNPAFNDPPEALAGLAVEGVLTELCEAKRTALLATPYLSFDTRFLEREGEALRMWATMTRSVAENTLSQQPLRVRFPWALGMWAGPTRVLGFEQDEKRRYLRIAAPERLAPDELRRHYRVDRCGKTQGTLGNENLTVVKVTVENLSVVGALVFASGALDPAEFNVGRLVSLSLTLDGGTKLQSKVRIVHIDGFRAGLAFQPDLDGETLDRLSDWVRPRWMEAKKAWTNRAETRAQVEVSAAKVPEGLLLVTSDPELELQVRPVLEGLPELRVVPPVMASLKKALSPPPQLVLLHLPQGGLEERRRYKALVEALPEGPKVLLAGPQAVALAQELGSDLKAPSLAWSPSLGAFLARMVTGLLKKHSGSERT